MKRIIQRIKCLCGYHGTTRTFMLKTDQRIMLFVCSDCDKLIQKVRLSKSEGKSVRALCRKFERFPLR